MKMIVVTDLQCNESIYVNFAIKTADLIRDRDFYEVNCSLKISTHKTIQELQQELDEQLGPMFDDIAKDVQNQYLNSRIEDAADLISKLRNNLITQSKAILSEKLEWYGVLDIITIQDQGIENRERTDIEYDLKDMLDQASSALGLDFFDSENENP